MKEISRKKFLRVCGAIVAGGTVAGVSGVLLDREAMNAGRPASAGLNRADGDNTFVSPYRLVSSFETTAPVRALALHGATAYVATDGMLLVLDMRGKLQSKFSVGDEADNVIRDMAVGDDGAIYILHPAAVSVWSPDGTMLRRWEACSELSNYCSIALAREFVFVTDMDGKNICKYTGEGNFVTFISSPNRFIIPSLTFGIECIDDIIYCSNSGRHQVESYTLDGKYLGVFGRHGSTPGMFTGCCNPVHLAQTANGDIITSEKGSPRICCYGRDGAFRSMLLDGRTLGGGNTAYDVQVRNDRIFVAGKNKVSVFRYDKTLAAAGACASCAVNCLLREGTNV
jgi:hypothetical protein